MDFYKVSYDSIKKYNSGKTKILKDSSIKAYLQSIKKLSKELFNSNKPNIQYLKDHESIISYLENDVKSISTKKGICTAIIVLIKSNETFRIENKKLVDIYSEYHKKIAAIQNDNYLDNEKTEKEKSNWVTRDDIRNIIDKLSKSFLAGDKKIGKRIRVDNAQMHLVLNLYTMLPPVRNDYAMTKIINGKYHDIDPEKLDKCYNHINIIEDTGKLYLCNYKTSTHYGIKTIEIPKELVSIIKKFVNLKREIFGEKLEHQFLLINTTNLTPMTKNGLTKYINKIFLPKKVSTTMLRKIYISEQFPVTNTMREMQDASYIMGHDIGTARKVYAKVL
jgi:hypothetical protein